MLIAVYFIFADAIRFALGSAPTSLRVNSLAEVQSSISKEPCYVSLVFVTMSAAETTRNCIETTLLSDGTRQAKLNGRLKQKKEIKVGLALLSLFS